MAEIGLSLYNGSLRCDGLERAESRRMKEGDFSLFAQW